MEWLASRLHTQGHDKIPKREDAYQEATSLADSISTLDPADVGQSFDSVIGINSQSGKAGVSWVLLQELGLDLPSDVAMEFARATKTHLERLGRGLVALEVCDLFMRTFSVNEVSKHIWLSGHDVKLGLI
jgi:isopropylmalate/homocitrate/citramalate synthase